MTVSACIWGVTMKVVVQRRCVLRRDFVEVASASRGMSISISFLNQAVDAVEVSSRLDSGPVMVSAREASRHDCQRSAKLLRGSEVVTVVNLNDSRRPVE